MSISFSQRLIRVIKAALCDNQAYDEFSAAVVGTEFDSRLLYDLQLSTNVVANATYTGSFKPILIPAGTFLYGFMISSAAPGGTAGGAKTIKYSIGTVANAGIDLLGANEVDVMVATAGLVASANVHGDATGDNAAGYFADVPFGIYIATPTTLYVNYIGQSAGATVAPGTVSCGMKVYALVARLF